MHSCNVKPHRLECSLITSWSSAVTEWTAEVTNKIIWMTWAEVASLRLLCCSCLWHNISLCDCNSPDGTVETPCSPPLKINHRYHMSILNVPRVGSLVFLYVFGAQRKDTRDSIQYAFLIYFCRKIGLFTCKSNVFIEEYEKNLCQGIPEWHSKNVRMNCIIQKV